MTSFLICLPLLFSRCSWVLESVIKWKDLILKPWLIDKPLLSWGCWNWKGYHLIGLRIYVTLLGWLHKWGRGELSSLGTFREKGFVQHQGREFSVPTILWNKVGFWVCLAAVILYDQLLARAGIFPKIRGETGGETKGVLLEHRCMLTKQVQVVLIVFFPPSFCHLSCFPSPGTEIVALSPGVYNPSSPVWLFSSDLSQFVIS